MAQPPLPPPGEFIKSVRESSKSIRIATGIQIKPKAIERFIHSAAFSESFARLSSSHGLAMPLRFPSVISELNLLSVLSLLNFASAYRVPLHAATGRGAYDTIRAFVFSLFLSSSDEQGPNNLLSAAGMKQISRERVAELMQVSLHIEKPHPELKGVILGELGGPIFEMVELVAKTLNETGSILIGQGYPDLGSFVAEALDEAKRRGDRTGSPPSAEVVLERLVRAFPGFQDMHVINDQPVYIFKRALFLIHAIALRFQSTASLPIPDTTNLPVFSDNVLPSMLVHLGVIDLSTATVGNLRSAFPNPQATVNSLLSATPKTPEGAENAAKVPPVEGPVLTHAEAYTLRAAAVDACELIVATARECVIDDDPEKQAWMRKITLPELDGWLWAVAKDRKDYRALPRFVERPTVFF